MHESPPATANMALPARSNGAGAEWSALQRRIVAALIVSSEAWRCSGEGYKIREASLSAEEGSGSGCALRRRPPCLRRCHEGHRLNPTLKALDSGTGIWYFARASRSGSLPLCGDPRRVGLTPRSRPVCGIFSLDLTMMLGLDVGEPTRTWSSSRGKRLPARPRSSPNRTISSRACSSGC